MTSVSISISGASPIKIVADGNVSIDAILSTFPELRGNLDHMLIICNQRLLSKSKTLNEQQIHDGARILVCPCAIDISALESKKIRLSKQIEEIAMEAVRIMDWKINRVLDEPRVMRSFTTYIQNEYLGEENSQSTEMENLKTIPTKVPVNRASKIPTEPLPMIWKNDVHQVICEENQDPCFQTVTEARKYYSHQLTEHGWEW